MIYPFFRNRFRRVWAWLSRARRLRRCRKAERSITPWTGSGGGGGLSNPCNRRRTSGNVRPSATFFPQPPGLQLQEPQGQQHQGHVVVPAQPATDLVGVQAHFLL